MKKFIVTTMWCSGTIGSSSTKRSFDTMKEAKEYLKDLKPKVKRDMKEYFRGFCIVKDTDDYIKITDPEHMEFWEGVIKEIEQ